MVARLRTGRTPLSHVQPAHQQVADQLQDLILTGELSSGDRLPPELELAEQFEVSRGTLRAAFKVLRASGLILTTRGAAGGTFVAPFDVSQVEGRFGALSSVVDLNTAVTASSMLETRRMVEIPTAGLAADRRRPEHLEAMASALEGELGPDRWARFSKNRSFHQVMIDAADNSTLVLITDPLFRLLQAKFLCTLVDSQVWLRINEEHHAIYEAIERQDARMAIELMTVHLSTLQQVYRR